MKAIRIHKNGGPEVLRIDDIDEPQPNPGEIKVKIMASSLNHMDLWVRKGMPGIGPFPLTLGCDGSGVVDEVGEGVTKLKTGDRVYLYPLISCKECQFCKSGLPNHCKDFKILGEHLNGVHCESICLPEEHVFPLADNVSFEEAAAFPLTFITAWHMLVHNGQVKEGDDVLIMGSSSGVGVAAIQIAKHFGATVIATAGSEEKMAKAKEQGADHVINHYKDSISKNVKEITNKKGADIVFEHVGEKVWQECLKSLAWSGKLITCGATSGPSVSLDLRHVFIKQQQILGSTLGTPDELQLVHDLIASQKISAPISRVFTPKEITDAHQFLEDSQHVGKIVLKWE